MLWKFWDKIAPSGKQLNHDIIILDDIFPLLLSSFRVTEFNAILQRFERAAVYSSGSNFKALGGKRIFADVHSEYASLYSDYSQRVHRFHHQQDVKAQLCYIMFLNNVSFFYDFLLKYNIAYVLELYPGGGFLLNDKGSDLKLKTVLSSPLLRKVIVTQKATYDYLVVKQFCTPEKIEFIFGVVLPCDLLTGTPRPKRYFPQNKSRMDICFVAHKYMEKGRDKGYDVFIEVAHILADSVHNVFFHVVGPYDEKDIDITKLKHHLTFYGSRTTEFFPEFYAGMDIILSPNAPDVLNPGAFDGFPTGACVEAGLCGSAVFACDELGLNPFVDGEELVIIPRDPRSIAEMITRYLQAPELLYKVSQRGRNRFSEVFSMESQMAPRIKVLENVLNQGGL